MSLFKRQDIRVEIFANRMVLISEKPPVTVSAKTPFTTNRLLIGNFSPAVDCLKAGLERLDACGYFKSKPKLTIYPGELSDGGLSEIEQRVLREVALEAGAGEVEIDEGNI